MGSEFEVTEQELGNIKKALEQEEFRKLFADYVAEISDPKNKQLYEKEIAALEAEQGNNVEFINPEAGFVVKTSSINTTKATKVFINICTSDKVDKATSKAAVQVNGKSGSSWSIPYSLGQKRIDKDHAGVDCWVWDCCFHPEVYAKAMLIPELKKLIVSSALEGVESKFDVKLDHAYRIPKMKSKGVIQSTIIREKDPKLKPAVETSSNYLQGLMNASTNQTGIEPQPKKALIQEIPDKVNVSAVAESPTILEPKYKIIHQGQIDYSRMTNARHQTEGARPDAIVIKIELPKTVGFRLKNSKVKKSVSEIDLDISEDRLVLEVKDRYSLDLKLPFPVEDSKAAAQYDKDKKHLQVTIPVILKIVEIPEIHVEINETAHAQNVSNQEEDVIVIEKLFVSTEEIQESKETSENALSFKSIPQEAQLADTSASPNGDLETESDYRPHFNYLIPEIIVDEYQEPPVDPVNSAPAILIKDKSQESAENVDNSQEAAEIEDKHENEQVHETVNSDSFEMCFKDPEITQTLPATEHQDSFTNSIKEGGGMTMDSASSQDTLCIESNEASLMNSNPEKNSSFIPKIDLNDQRLSNFLFELE